MKSLPATTSPTEKALLLLIVVILSLGSIGGCANHQAKTRELLSQNFHQLSDDDLILYYYKLEDQIEIVEQARTRSTVSLGLGVGSFGHHSGGSGTIGVSTGGSKQSIASDLRKRRNQVKLELKHRGITP